MILSLNVQAHTERQIANLANDKQNLQVQLDSSYTQITTLQHRVSRIEIEMDTQAEQHAMTLKVIKAEHDRFATDVGREKDSLCRQLATLERDKAAAIADRNKLAAEIDPMRVSSALEKGNAGNRWELTLLLPV